MDDLINRQAAIDAVCESCSLVGDYHKCDGYPKDSTWCEEVTALRNVPSAQPDNQTNLCDSCDYSYPDCPSKNDDVIFGNGIGNDNICACNKYKPSAQPEAKTNVNGDWVILNKDKILKAGMEGREIEFRIGGRLFAIREKAQ